MFQDNPEVRVTTFMLYNVSGQSWGCGYYLYVCGMFQDNLRIWVLFICLCNVSGQPWGYGYYWQLWVHLGGRRWVCSLTPTQHISWSESDRVAETASDMLLRDHVPPTCRWVSSHVICGQNLLNSRQTPKVSSVTTTCWKINRHMYLGFDLTTLTGCYFEFFCGSLILVAIPSNMYTPEIK